MEIKALIRICRLLVFSCGGSIIKNPLAEIFLFESVNARMDARTTARLLYYTEQKKKRNNRPPRIFEFKGKTLIISGLLLYDSHSWDIRVYHARN